FAGGERLLERLLERGRWRYNALFMSHDRYESPLVTRNASEEMLRLFSPRTKFTVWRKLWVELARAQRELGLERIGDEAIRQMEAAVDRIDFDAAEKWEARLRHDVMAHVHTFE